jgi:hypothetical protein
MIPALVNVSDRGQILMSNLLPLPKLHLGLRNSLKRAGVIVFGVVITEEREDLINAPSTSW